MENVRADNGKKLIETPVQQKRQKTLGIRYSAINNYSKTSFTEVRTADCLSKKMFTETKSPRTPLSTSENTQIVCKSTGHIPAYRLSLKRKIIRKKRLHFVENSELNASIENVEVNNLKNTPDSDLKEPKSKRSKNTSNDKKLEKLENSDNNNEENTEIQYEKQNKVENIEVDNEKHNQRVTELKNLIVIWKEGFKKALEDLNKKISPPREKAELLELLNISPQMINYV